jgi:hypothetical protein
MSELNVSNAPQGKGMAVTGFILSLVGILVPFNVIAVLMGSAALAYFGLILCILSVALSAMGMSKLGKTGGKKGLGIAGLVIGLVATVWTVLGVMQIGEAIDARNKLGGEFERGLMEMQKDMN